MPPVLAPRRTLNVPENFMKALSPGQHQWWTFKAKNFDSVLLFKMGKFYEVRARCGGE